MEGIYHDKVRTSQKYTTWCIDKISDINEWASIEVGGIIMPSVMTKYA